MSLSPLVVFGTASRIDESWPGICQQVETQNGLGNWTITIGNRNLQFSRDRRKLSRSIRLISHRSCMVAVTRIERVTRGL